jgi:hypothetical protein
MKKSVVSKDRLFQTILFTVALLSPSVALAQNARLTDDLRVSSTQPNTNFKGGTTLQVQAGSDRSLVKFDLSPLPAGTSGNNIAKATLRVWVNAVPTPGSIDVVRVTSGWSEAVTTNATAPSVGSKEATAVPITEVNSFVSVDVTPLVKDWLNGVLPNNGVALVANAPGTSVRFDSKENALTSHQAELEIALSAATLGANNFSGNQNVAGSLELSTSNIAGISSTTSNTSFFAVGVQGLATGAAGVTRGVFGRSSSPNGIGVHGIGSIGGQFETGTGNILVGRGLGLDRFVLAANGDMSTKGSLRVDNNVSIGGSGTIGIDLPGEVGGRLQIEPNGNVGIGTNQPHTKVSVRGDAEVVGILDIGQYTESAAVTVTPRTTGDAVAVCSPGRKVLAGGFLISGPGATAARTLIATWPASKDRWKVEVANDPGPIGGADITVIASAICARIKL